MLLELPLRVLPAVVHDVLCNEFVFRLTSVPLMRSDTQKLVVNNEPGLASIFVALRFE